MTYVVLFTTFRPNHVHAARSEQWRKEGDDHASKPLWKVPRVLLPRRIVEATSMRVGPTCLAEAGQWNISLSSLLQGLVPIADHKRMEDLISLDGTRILNRFTIRPVIVVDCARVQAHY